jgi:Flp pilus assembly protein TadB
MKMSAATIAKILMALSLASITFYAIEWLNKWLGRRKFSKSLADYYQPLAPQEDRSVRVGSFEHKIRLAALRYRLNVAGREGLYYYGAIALLALTVLIVLVILGIPPMLYLLAPLVGWAVVNSQINGVWETTRLALEKELPTFLLRLSATIQATPNVPEAITDVVASLDPSGPLQAWMKRLLVAIQTSGRKGLDEMREEAASISPSLFMAIMEIERLWETGGSGYVEAFRLASDNLASILEARAMAAARADGAKSTVRVILIALGGALVLAMSGAAGGGLFNTPLVQIGLLLAIAWAIIGWNLIGDMIRDAST